jgi:hypothetical protein
MPSASRVESPLPTAAAPRAIARGIRPNKAENVSFAPEVNADEEYAVLGCSSSTILSRLGKMLLVRTLALGRDLWSRMVPE